MSRAPDPTHKQKIRYSLTEPGIQLVPIMAHLGAWGRRHLPASRELAIRAELLEAGGPELWDQFMDELREHHLGLTRPAPSPCSPASKPPTKPASFARCETVLRANYAGTGSLPGASKRHDDVQTDSCCGWRGLGGGRGRRVFHAQGERGRAVPVGGPGAGKGLRHQQRQRADDGGVSVELNGQSAARIDQIVEGLPSANLGYICAENEQEYHIAFTADAGAGVRQGFGLTGYWCNNLVVETLSHGTTMDRIDRDCALLAAVRRLLPARATATHAVTCAHANGRLFLAVSRTSTHKAPTHKAPTHKTPRLEAPRHGTARYGAPVRVTPGRGTLGRAMPARRTPGRGTPGRGTPGRETPGRGTPGSGTRDVKKVVTAPTLA
jgi:hypothetical protein